MGYTILDIMNKLLDIEKNGRDFYLNLAARQPEDIKLATVARILSKEEERHILLYSNMLNSEQSEASQEISFDVYDRAVKLLNDFIRVNKSPETKDAKDLILWALAFEKENLALVLSIRGLLVRSTEDSESYPYRILSEVIQEEEKHINNLEQFVR